MVRLGIISDSHNRSTWIERYLELANRQKYDAVFHLGDGASDVRWLRRRLEMPLICVAGNCDFYTDAPRETVETFDGKRILAVHGHLFDVKWGLEHLSYHAEEQNATIALYGHTHDPMAAYVGPVLMINPGALLNGRYAELLLDGRHIVPQLKKI